MHELGAEGVAFPPIVAAGANGALPHASPGDRAIEPGQTVVVDAAAKVDGYNSDCTRTFATGRAAGRARAARTTSASRPSCAGARGDPRGRGRPGGGRGRPRR